MALNKSIPVHGFPVTYWRILDHHFNYNVNQVMFNVAGYKDEATRRADPNDYAITKDFALAVTEAIFGGKTPRQRTYAWLKTQPEMAGATDILEAGQST
jgi:hypothetical protein